MNKIKHYIGLIILVVISSINIAALQVEDAPIDENNTSRSCVFGYTNLYYSHQFCSGMVYNGCIDPYRDDYYCVQVNYLGTPKIIVTPE